MGLRKEFRLFGALRAGAGGLLAMLMLTFVLAGAAISSPPTGSALPFSSFDMHGQAALGEAWLPRGAVPRVPDHPVQCLERDHPCSPGAIQAAHAELLVLSLAQRASFITPRGREPLAASEAAPHVATSFSILFRNIRE
jgi:hypothetical protein